MSGTEPVQPGEFRLEVVVVPVSDVDRAKAFYDSLGWRLDADLAKDDNYRVVQFTPPGSTCSIIFGKGLTDSPPGSFEGLQLTVYDIDKARADLVEQGVRRHPDPFHDVTGVFHHAGTERRRVDGPAPEHADYGSFAAFKRSGWQRLATPGDQDPPAWALSEGDRWPPNTNPPTTSPMQCAGRPRHTGTTRSASGSPIRTGRTGMHLYMVLPEQESREKSSRRE